MTTGMRRFVVVALVGGFGASAMAQPAAPAPKKTGAAGKRPASARKQEPEPVVLGPDAPTKMLYIAEIAEPTATEGLAPAVIREKLRASGDPIDDCYADAAKKHPTLEGTVELKFRIAKTGAVANASATGVAGASACIAKVVSRIKFAAPPQPVDVTTTIKLVAARYRPMLGTMKVDNQPSDFWKGAKSEVQLESFTIAAGIDTATVLDMLEQHKAGFLTCYDKVANLPPGAVDVAFHIEPTGAPSQLVVKGLPKVDDCVATAIKALTFPRPTAKDIEVSGVIRFVRVVGTLAGSAPSASDSIAPASGPAAPTRDHAVTGAHSVVSIGQPDVTPANLDKALVRRYVKRSLHEVQGCYEKQLASSPKLAGTVTATFRIEANGNVSSASASGLAKVDTCVAGVIKGIAFPKPKDAAVDVTYAFTFRPVPDAAAVH